MRALLENPLKAEKDGRSAIALGLVPPEGLARAGATAPPLGRRDVGATAKQRTRDLVEQTRRFIQNPRGSLPHYPTSDVNRGFGG